MKKVIYSIIQYGTLLVLMLSLGYMALPIEYQEMIPFYNDITAIVTGLSGGSIFGVMTWVDNKLNNAEQKTNDKVNDVALSQVKIVDLLGKLLSRIDTLETKEEDKAHVTNDLKNELTVVKELLYLDLNTKASSPLIEKHSKELIKQQISKLKNEVNGTVGVDHGQEEVESSI